MDDVFRHNRDNRMWVVEYHNPDGDGRWRQWNWNMLGGLDEVIPLMVDARRAYRPRANYNWRLRNLSTGEIIPGDVIEE